MDSSRILKGAELERHQKFCISNWMHPKEHLHDTYGQLLRAGNIKVGDTTIVISISTSLHTVSDIFYSLHFPGMDNTEFDNMSRTSKSTSSLASSR